MEADLPDRNAPDAEQAAELPPTNGDPSDPDEAVAETDEIMGGAQRPIVAGIGASAGGVEALQAFFEAVPENLGVAFVVIVHLSPEHRSELAEILGRKTNLPVEQVEGTIPLRGDCVYVIPPDRRLQITDSEVGAFPFDEPRGQRAPIDTFFRSLAAQHGDGFAVILSGGGSDGAVGVKAVKEAGGLILVQDPSEAAFDSMPRAAIATEMADLVLPVRELAGRLADLTHTKRRIRETLTPDPAALDGDREAALGRILTHLHARTGHDFTKYKRATVLRRIGRRMQVHRKESLGDYLAFLRQNVEEAKALFDDLLISVTTFFRDPEAWEALAETVVPKLFDEHDPDAPLRLWVPGCATGEEAYSLAILLLEEAERRNVWPEVQVFASDLDEGALATAREGRYPAAIEADVSTERLHRFFVREGTHYRITKELRDCALFATHSLLRDPPFSRLDLVSCRNLLIYLDHDLQNQVFGVIRYALRPGGYLFLGVSETAESDYFRTLDKRHHLFQVRETTGHEHPHLPDLLLSTPRVRTPAEHEHARRDPPPAHIVHQTLLEDLAPPSILVDENRRTLHLSETVGRFLRLPGGAPTRDVTELVRTELQAELRAALFRAFERGETTLSPFVPVQFNGTPQRVAVLVRPRRGTGDDERLALVIFLDGGDAPSLDDAAEGQSTDETVRGLQAELRRTQEQMRTRREEHEATTEELRATNEELQSINEEYRSTAEELETSKEELQSLNEELHTVNNELKDKLDEISRAHSDLENLMAATEIGTLFLDRRFRIQRFTPRVEELFNVTQNDRGRPLSDFTHRLHYENLESDVRQVLDDLQPIEHEVRSAAGQWFLVRLRPYRTTDDRIDGVVVTFVDITERREAEEDLRRSEERYRLLFEGVEEYAIFTMDLDGRITTWNSGAEALFGYDDAEALGRPVSLLFTEEDRAAGKLEQEMTTAARERQADDERWHVRKDGSRFWGSGVMTALYNAEGELRGLAKVLRDNTERKAAEDALRRANETLELRVEERTEQVRELASTLTVAEQDERHRIAQVLHDDLQQLLFGIQLKMTFVRQGAEAADVPDLAAHAEESEDLLDRAIDVSRRLTVDLSPPVLAGEGLADTLEWLTTQMQEVHGLTVEIRASDAFSIPQEGVRVLLFQIIRELLFNIVKHAGTDHATVTLEAPDGHLVITVEDGGDGFDPEAVDPNPESGFGLFNVRDRLRLFGGRLEIDSVPGDGTRIVATLPVPPAPAP